jgi:nucleoid-associated protein YgaU
MTATRFAIRPTARLLPGLAAAATLLLASMAAHAVNFPVTPQQRATAQQVAQAGVPLSELAPNAPDSYTVKRGDTLWAISRLYLRSPWRWPELWGMNLSEIRNPHLIFPGQVLVLEKGDGRARLRVAQPGGGTVKLSPRVRSEPFDSPIASIPLGLIEPFLNEAVVFNAGELDSAPRIVASQEGRVYLGRGDLAYVRGDVGAQRDYRIFRQPRALLDPTTKETLGYEAVYVGTAQYVREGGPTAVIDRGETRFVPSTFSITSTKLEAGVGDRLSPVPPRDFATYAPRAPQGEVAGQIVSIYGEGVTAGQNQIVALNRGASNGIERGHVLALWKDGATRTDVTEAGRPTIKLPDERHGLLFVFRVFDRVSYALILQAERPVVSGDRFTQP